MHGELPGPIHGALIKADELWACTTCMACVQECPAFIDIVDTIIDLRRYLALSEGALPSTAPQSLQNIQRAGNPWGLPAGERLAWAQGLEVPLMEPGREVEYLYWVGCSASYDRRNQAIARSVVKILKTAGVSFGVMQEERCHAEVGRRLGEEYLYQTVAQENVDAARQYKFRKVITHCPHCFNTIKNEFPQFGGTYEVLHHSQVIEQLIADGRIKPRKPLDATLAFHDSCYLGRYNGLTEAPRKAAKIALGAAVLYLVSPVDLIPDFVPVLGYLDDVFVAAILIDGMLNFVDRGLVLKYWPGSPESLERIARSARVLAAWVPRRLKLRIFSSPS